MATSRDALRSPATLSGTPGPAVTAPLADEDVEEVDVDDDVSAADLTGEALLPASESLPAEDDEPEPEPPTAQEALDAIEADTLAAAQGERDEPDPVADRGEDVEHTAPRAQYPMAPVTPASGVEPLFEPTAPELAAPAAGIREQARILSATAATLAIEDPTGETSLPGSDEAPEPLTPLQPAPPLEDLVPAEAIKDVVLSGSLSAVPLIDVLGLLGRQRQTGLLSIVEDGRRIDITLQQGQVAQATATGFQELRLGRFVVELDAAAATEIDELAGASARQPGAAPLGARLCQLGYLSREDLRHVLSRQSQELIYEALRLRRGRFLFSQPAALPRLAVDRALGADLHLDLEALLLEGYRRIHDWHLVERELEQGAVYMRSDERAPTSSERVGLTREEQQVLTLCTGKNAVSDIARDSRLGALDVVRILQRLQAVNLVRRRLPPQAV